MKRDWKQIIKTARGDLPIDQIKVGDEILGYYNNEFIFHRVEQIGQFSQPNRTVEINGKYFFAPDQSIFVKRKIKNKYKELVVHATEIERNDLLTSELGGHIRVKWRPVIVKHKESFSRTLLTLNKGGFFKRLWNKFTGNKFNRSYFLNGILVHNATRTGAAGGGNWSSTGTWVEGSVPTNADDVILDGTSGNITINTGATRVCRSLDCTGYTGTLTHNASTNLDIGDNTAGAGNIALKFSAGMTYSIGNVNTSLIQFISNSATQQTIDTGGKDLPRFVLGGSSGGSWILSSNVNCTSTNGFTDLNRGSLNTNDFSVTCFAFRSQGSATRSLTLGASTITLNGASNNVWQVNGSNMTLSALSSTILCTASSQTFTPAIASHTYGTLTMSGNNATLTSASTINTVNMTGSGTAFIAATLTAPTFNRTGTALKTDGLQLSANMTVSTSLTLAGNSGANRLYVRSNALETARTITYNGAGTPNASYVDFEDITGAGSGSWDLSAITGGSGNCRGNSGMTLSPSQTETWSGTTGGNYSANAWTTRVPLPQDTASFNGVAFSASQTVTSDMPRVGTITFTGATGSPTFALSGQAPTIYGSITFISAMSLSGSAAITWRGSGGAHTITSAGKSWASTSQVFACPGATYTLQDALGNPGGITHTHGGLNFNNFNVTTSTFNTSATTTRSLTMGTGTLTLTSTGAVTIWNAGTTTGLTFSGASSTILISAGAGNTRTFSGGGLSYGTLRYTVAFSNGILLIAGSNTFNTALNVLAEALSGKSLQFTAGTTQTLANGSVWQVNGISSSRRVTITSSVAGSKWFLAVASGIVESDWIDLKDSTGSGNVPFYAGANSTDSGNNTNWNFTASQTNISVSDSFTGTDVANMASITFNIADSGDSVDVAAIANSFQIADSGTFQEAVQMLVNLDVLDAGLLEDLVQLLVQVSLTETVTGEDLVNAANIVIVNEIGSVSELIAVLNAFQILDTFDASEALTVSKIDAAIKRISRSNTDLTRTNDDLSRTNTY